METLEKIFLPKMNLHGLLPIDEQGLQVLPISEVNFRNHPARAGSFRPQFSHEIQVKSHPGAAIIEACDVVQPVEHGEVKRSVLWLIQKHSVVIYQTHPPADIQIGRAS